MSTKNNNNIKGQSLPTPPVINHVDQAASSSQSDTQQSSNGAPPPPVIDEEPAESDTDHDGSAASLDDSLTAPPPSLESRSSFKSDVPVNGPPDDLFVDLPPGEIPGDQTSPIRSAFRRPSDRTGDRIQKRVTIMPSEDGADVVAGAAAAVAPPSSAEDTSIRVTEKIKKGTFKESQIIFKAGPPLADTLEKLEKKDETVTSEASLPKDNTSMSSVTSMTITSTQAIATPVPIEKGKASTEEKKKNREDRKKEKEKKKEEEMLFHHEREQEKKTKIVGTDKYDPDTGEMGQWLKHAFLVSNITFTRP